MNTNNDIFLAEDQDTDFDILKYLFSYLRYWYWFVLTIAVSLVGAHFYLERVTPIYKVFATLLIKDEQSPRKANDIVEDFTATANKRIENEIVLLTSMPLLGKVVDELNLTVTYWTESPSRDIEVYDNSPITLIAGEVTDYAYGNPVFVVGQGGTTYQLLDAEEKSIGVFQYGAPVASKYGNFRIVRKDLKKRVVNTRTKVTFASREAMVDMLIGSIAISRLNEYSSFLSVSIETALIDKGKAILSKLLDEYAFASLEDKNREATNTLRFIEERLRLVTSELGTVEQNVEKYRRAKGITDLSSETTLFLKEEEQNNAKLNEVDIQLNVLESIERYVNGAKLTNVAPATLMVNDPVLNAYVTQLLDLEIERSKLAQSVHPGNPYLETVRSQMNNVKQAIKENLTNQRNNLLVTKNSLLATKKRLEASILSVPTKERELVEIKRQAGIKENLYLMLLQKREETALSYASTVTDSRVVNTPYPSGGQIRPNRQNVFLAAGLIGLLLPIFLITIRNLVTTTVQSKKEIERKSGLKVFGEVGINPKQSGTIIDVRNKSFVSEQIRTIRSNLQYLLSDYHHTGGRTILITSSTANEGKSFLTLNIAISLAALNKQVLILGVDLRKPKINQYLNVSNHIGISDYLIGSVNAQDIVQATSIDNVFIAPSGPIPANPSELLSSIRTRNLIDEYRLSYDFILLDTPPFSLVTDASILAPYSDICFYLVRHEKTPKVYLNHIADLNNQKIFKSVNIIFNAVNYKTSPDYGYGYEYGPDGYYGTGSGKNKFLGRLFGGRHS
ncbi:GumC family protein [Spirosoma fluminis]